MVLEREMFRREQKTPQMEYMNCALRSEVILAGTPNLDIQPGMRTLAQSAVEMEDKETASGLLLEGICQRAEEQGRTTNKLPVEGNHALEPL